MRGWNRNNLLLLLRLIMILFPLSDFVGCFLTLFCVCVRVCCKRQSWFAGCADATEWGNANARSIISQYRNVLHFKFRSTGKNAFAGDDSARAGACASSLFWFERYWHSFDHSLSSIFFFCFPPTGDHFRLPMPRKLRIKTMASFNAICWVPIQRFIENVFF